MKLPLPAAAALAGAAQAQILSLDAALRGVASPTGAAIATGRTAGGPPLPLPPLMPGLQAAGWRLRERPLQ
jgi:hypothetical protein